MQSSGVIRRVARVGTEVSEECSASINKVTRIDELGTTLAVTVNLSTLQIVLNRNKLRLIVTAKFVPSSLILVTLMIEAIRSSETSVFIRATRRNVSKDGILLSHRRESLKSCVTLTGWTL
jgi:hypothetical protein